MVETEKLGICYVFIGKKSQDSIASMTESSDSVTEPETDEEADAGEDFFFQHDDSVNLYCDSSILVLTEFLNFARSRIQSLCFLSQKANRH